MDLIPPLPKDRTYICETEDFEQDIQNFAWTANEAQRGNLMKVFHDKSDFIDQYLNAGELFPKHLSRERRRNLRILLNDDVLAWTELRNTFGQKPKA